MCNQFSSIERARPRERPTQRLNLLCLCYFRQPDTKTTYSPVTHSEGAKVCYGRPPSWASLKTNGAQASACRFSVSSRVYSIAPAASVVYRPESTWRLPRRSPSVRHQAGSRIYTVKDTSAPHGVRERRSPQVHPAPGSCPQAGSGRRSRPTGAGASHPHTFEGC